MALKALKLIINKPALEI